MDDFILAKGILEVRYPRAHRYWDVSGEVITKIESQLPALECFQMGATGIEFRGRTGCGVETGSFGWDRMILALEVGGLPDRFEQHAVTFWSILADGFDLNAVARVGNRYSYLFKTDTTAAADTLLADSRIWSLSDSLVAFGEADARGAVLRTVLRDHDRRVRLEIAPGEQTIRDRKQSGVVLDIDFSALAETAAQSLDVRAFLHWNRRFLKENLHEVLRVRA